MLKTAGIGSLSVGGLLALLGFILWSYLACSVTSGNACFSGVYPYRDLGMLAMVFGGVLIVLGITFWGISERPPRPTRGGSPTGTAVPGGRVAFPPLQKLCAACGSRYPLEYNLCPRDGTVLQPEPPPRTACPRCGAVVRPTDRFCAQCGFQGGV